ncbi:MAG: hypothetical protein IKN46_02555 [Acholeplasmatales bacterium]|nr:hypothetical protein [Acholeplasmatales bacterium]
MREVRLMINKVVDVPPLVSKIVKEKLGVEVDAFYNKKIETEEKTLYIYSFEYTYSKIFWDWEPLSRPSIFVPTLNTKHPIATITIIASIKDDSTIIVLLLPSDEENDPNKSSIITGFKEEGFKIVATIGMRKINV